LEARAVEKYMRISPRKVKLVIDLVRDKKVEDAVNILSFTPKKAAELVRKAINSAASNAVENHGMEEDGLFISKIYVNEGPILKRFRPRARGRATRIRKRTSHITVIVSDGKEEEEQTHGTKS